MYRKLLTVLLAALFLSGCGVSSDTPKEDPSTEAMETDPDDSPFVVYYHHTSGGFEGVNGGYLVTRDGRMFEWSAGAIESENDIWPPAFTAAAADRADCIATIPEEDIREFLSLIERADLGRPEETDAIDPISDPLYNGDYALKDGDYIEFSAPEAGCTAIIDKWKEIYADNSGD